MGESIRSTVKNAAKFAVYDDIMMSVKNHHIPVEIGFFCYEKLLSLLSRHNGFSTCLQPFELTML